MASTCSGCGTWILDARVHSLSHNTRLHEWLERHGIDASRVVRIESRKYETMIFTYPVDEHGKKHQGDFVPWLVPDILPPEVRIAGTPCEAHA